MLLYIPRTLLFNRLYVLVVFSFCSAWLAALLWTGWARLAGFTFLSPSSLSLIGIKRDHSFLLRCSILLPDPECICASLQSIVQVEWFYSEFVSSKQLCTILKLRNCKSVDYDLMKATEHRGNWQPCFIFWRFSVHRLKWRLDNLSNFLCNIFPSFRKIRR